MGSRSRARKRYAKERDAIISRVSASDTPRVQLVKELGNVRMHGAGTKLGASKPAHVLAKESAGHQYIGGSRARGVSLTRAERMLNETARRKRETMRQQGKASVDTGRGNQGTIVAGLELGTKDLTTVSVSQGQVKRLTTAEQRERLLSGRY